MTDLAVRPAESLIDQWERQPGESGAAFTAFAFFRGMGGRRGLVKMRDENGAKWSLSKLAKWAEQWNWIDRAEAWDREVDRRKRQHQLDEIEAQTRRQIQIGQTLQEQGLRWIEEELATEKGRAKHLTATTAAKFIDTGIALERQALGVDDDEKNTDVNVTVNVLTVGAKAGVFAKINEMHANMLAVSSLSRSTAPVEEPVDAELVEDDEDL